MKILDVILLPLAAAFVIVGTHMMVTQGLVAAYPIFMFAVALFFWFRFRKVRSKAKEKPEPETMKKRKRKRRR